jgi:hypothetical protein
MRWLIRAAARLYPAPWRRRYGREFDLILGEEPATLKVLIDVLRSAGGTQMHDLARHSQRLALVGLVLLLPSAMLTVVSIMNYVLGITAPFDAVEPAMTPIVTHPLGETVLVLAPYAALLLSLLPVTRIGLGWHAGRLMASASLSAPLLNIAVAAISGALIVFMGLYWVVENL